MKASVILACADQLRALEAIGRLRVELLKAASELDGCEDILERASSLTPEQDLLLLPDHEAWFSPRSGAWEAKRKAHLLVAPACEACGGKTHCQVHHIVPYSWDPALELVDSNLYTLCENPGLNCHLWIGHLGDWKSRNPNCKNDAKDRLHRIMTRPYQSKQINSNVPIE